MASESVIGRVATRRRQLTGIIVSVMALTLLYVKATSVGITLYLVSNLWLNMLPRLTVLAIWHLSYLIRSSASLKSILHCEHVSTCKRFLLGLEKVSAHTVLIFCIDSLKNMYE